MIGGGAGGGGGREGWKQPDSKGDGLRKWERQRERIETVRKASNTKLDALGEETVN